LQETNGNKEPIQPPDTATDSVPHELIEAGTDLVAMTEEFFELTTSPSFTDADFVREGASLLAIYDEYLELLELEIDPGQGGTETDRTTAELEPLYIRFDYDRSVLAAMVGTMGDESLNEAVEGADPTVLSQSESDHLASLHRLA
jgi:hypothetical protein